MIARVEEGWKGCRGPDSPTKIVGLEVFRFDWKADRMVAAT